MLKPGQTSWELTLENHLTTNVVVQITDHNTTSTHVDLQRGTGTLMFTCNIPKAKIRWVEKGADLTGQATVTVPAGIKHAFEASYCGAYTNLTDISVAMGKTKPVEFVLDKAETWTNSIGMVFHLLPALGKRFWVGETRVTPKQYTAVMGANTKCGTGIEVDGRECVTEVSCTDARSFANKLGEKGLPSGFRADVPTTNEWSEVAKAVMHYSDKALGVIGMQPPGDKTFTSLAEWCINDRSSGQSLGGKISAEIGSKEISARITDPGHAVHMMTIRVVLVPR
jgi:hypothetical protein